MRSAIIVRVIASGVRVDDAVGVACVGVAVGTLNVRVGGLVLLGRAVRVMLAVGVLLRVGVGDR